MNSLPVELIVMILCKLISYDDIKMFIGLNKRIRRIYDMNKCVISKRLVEIFEIDYMDCNNFIYVMNECDIPMLFDVEYDWVEIIRLYFRFYNY